MIRKLDDPKLNPAEPLSIYVRPWKFSSNSNNLFTFNEIRMNKVANKPADAIR